MVNLELYKIFVTVAKEKNITKASEKLNLTQPAVTKHMKNLESLLETKLFIRSNHGIKLTKQGMELYEEIKNSVEVLTNVENKYLKMRDINLGIHSTILNKIFSDCMSEYYIKNTNSKINVLNEENEQMLLALKDGELDIIFSKKIYTKSNDKHIKFIKLGEWNEVLIANQNYKRKNKLITLEELKNTTIYMPKKTSETAHNFFQSLNSKYEDFKDIKHATYKTITEIIKNNDGVGLVTKEFVEEEIKKHKLCILNTEFHIKAIEFGIYINRERKFKELNKFVEIIENHFINKK